jgi:hypothetical protein
MRVAEKLDWKRLMEKRSVLRFIKYCTYNVTADECPRYAARKWDAKR